MVTGSPVEGKGRMDHDWIRQRPHLAPLVRKLDAVLQLADELYERGRASGDSVDYGEFEERVARATAEVDQSVHQIALSGLDVDAPFIRVWGKCYRACTASSERTHVSAVLSPSSARCTASSVSVKARHSIRSRSAPAS